MSKQRLSSLRVTSKVFSSQRGSLLIESVVALAVFTLVGYAVFRGVQTSYIGKRQVDSQATSENLIRNQIEYVFKQAYLTPGSSYLTVTPPTGYTVASPSVVYDSNSTDIAKVVVTVSKGGQTIKSLEMLRTNR